MCLCGAAPGQFAAARRVAMPRVALILLLCACALARATIIADQTTLSDRLQKLYDKLEHFAPTHTEPPLELKNQNRNLEKIPTMEKLHEKLDRLNSLTPDFYAAPADLAEDEEELMEALQEWGMLDADMIPKDPQKFKYDDGDYYDEEDDYAMDDGEELEPEVSHQPSPDPTPITMKYATPSALNRLDRLGAAISAMSGVTETRAVPRGSGLVELENVASAADSIAATKERPRILDDSSLTRLEQAGVARAARAYLSAMVPRGKCLTPQPRWLAVRHMAPASDTLYRPTCVLLHRCAADTGCCHNEEHVCAPVEGQYVIIPLYLRKPEGLIVARMQFFNHTRCACVSQDTLQTVPRPLRPIRHEGTLNSDNGVQDSQDRHHDKYRATRQEQSLESTSANQSDWPTQEPRLESETVAPPQLKRCTCPTLFLARASDAGCACVCDWVDQRRRRDCLSLSRGREHFGLRDRVCISNGDCNPPTCEDGAYETNFGRCPLLKRYRRLRFRPGKYLDRTLTGS